jgi:hypothetical protein
MGARGALGGIYKGLAPCSEWGIYKGIHFSPWSYDRGFYRKIEVAAIGVLR